MRNYVGFLLAVFCAVVLLILVIAVAAWHFLGLAR